METVPRVENSPSDSVEEAAVLLFLHLSSLVFPLPLLFVPVYFSACGGLSSFVTSQCTPPHILQALPSHVAIMSPVFDHLHQPSFLLLPPAYPWCVPSCPDPQSYRNILFLLCIASFCLLPNWFHSRFPVISCKLLKILLQCHMACLSGLSFVLLALLCFLSLLLKC